MGEKLWCDWESVRNAFAVAAEVTRRIEELAEANANDCPGTRGEIEDACRVSVCVTEATLLVGVGEFTVWCDQSDSSDDLTPDYCITQFARQAFPGGIIANAIVSTEPESAPASPSP